MWASSHYGGHRYAGNCVVYPGTMSLRVVLSNSNSYQLILIRTQKNPTGGDWYGLVNTPEQAHTLVDTLSGDAPAINALWRGRINMTKEQQRAAFHDAVEH